MCFVVAHRLSIAKFSPPLLVLSRPWLPWLPCRCALEYSTVQRQESALVISQRQWLHGVLACEGDVCSTVVWYCTKVGGRSLLIS